MILLFTYLNMLNSNYYLAIVYELHRRENALANNEDSSTIVFDERKLKQNCLLIIKEMCDFEINAIKNKKSFKSGEDYIKSHPEELTASILNHVMYIFEIKELQGVLPKMNELYIYIQEQKNFLSTMREKMRLKNERDVLTEISKRIIK